MQSDLVDPDKRVAFDPAARSVQHVFALRVDPIARTHRDGLPRYDALASRPVVIFEDQNLEDALRERKEPKPHTGQRETPVDDVCHSSHQL